MDARSLRRRQEEGCDNNRLKMSWERVAYRFRFRHDASMRALGAHPSSRHFLHGPVAFVGTDNPSFVAFNGNRQSHFCVLLLPVRRAKDESTRCCRRRLRQVLNSSYSLQTIRSTR